MSGAEFADDEVSEYDPERHYDRVTSAWKLLMGAQFHYGVFDNDSDVLDVATEALTRRMIDAAALEPGLRVLDVGCGSGAPACGLAEEFGVEVVGITTSGVGVETARQTAQERGLTGVSFEQRDGTDNGFPDESFDRAWILEASHLMRDKAALISECARVLRPGGRLVLCDLIRHRQIPFLEVRERRDDFAVLREAFGDAHMEPLSLYAELAESQGLRVERQDDLSAATLLTFDRWRANAEQHRDAVVGMIGEDGLAAFVRSCDILEGFWRDGTFGYGLICAVRPT
jgi:cyclopropane fatty-acyl-phospholipid synthase-like methyltransferase